MGKATENVNAGKDKAAAADKPEEGAPMQDVPESDSGAIEDASESDSGAIQDAMIAAQLGRQEKVRIRIASGRDAHERCPVPVAVNGREFLIQRDREVTVPQGVLNVLLLANAQIAETSLAGSQTVTNFHPAPRFALTVLGPAQTNEG